MTREQDAGHQHPVDALAEPREPYSARRRHGDADQLVIINENKQNYRVFRPPTPPCPRPCLIVQGHGRGGRGWQGREWWEGGREGEWLAGM